MVFQRLSLVVLALLLGVRLAGAEPVAIDDYSLHGVVVDKTADALVLTMERDLDGGDKPTYARLPINFTDGVITVDVVSGINPASPPFVKNFARGFAGLAFRIAPENAAFEGFYVRPENGRADDAGRRAHATQYFAYPDWSFKRLREERPDEFERPADISSGETIQLRVEACGDRARFFVNGELNLDVTDLMSESAAGDIGLWIDAGTRAEFSNLDIEHWDTCSFSAASGRKAI